LDDTSFNRLVNIQSYTDEELKALASRLSAEEHEISKRRRLLHGEIDIIRAEMVRRLRDKHGAGGGLVRDGDVTILTDILTGHRLEDEALPTSGESAMPEDIEPVVRGIQKRFRDLSVDVREERVVRYIVKQLRQGRRVDDILADPYLVEHASEATRAHLLQHPAVIRAIEEEIRRQFADYRSVTGSASSDKDPD